MSSVAKKIKRALAEKEIRRNALLMVTPDLFPRFHCRKQIEYGVYEPENPIDLKNPKLFNEKLLWLRYYLYNKSPVILRCYDKYLVRDFVKEMGCGETLNELYYVWDSIDDIPWDDLPEQCAIKAANGCGGHTFRMHGEPINVEEAVKKLRHVEERRRLYSKEGMTFANKGKQRYLCEKLMLNENGGLPNDYKFYCFHGEPRFVLWISERYSKGGRKETYKTIDWQDRADICEDSEHIEVPKPSCYDEMVEIARKLSAPFPYVRVDLYDIGGHPVFGELTFAPGGSHTPNAQREMGELIDLTRINEYKKFLLSK